MSRPIILVLIAVAAAIILFFKYRLSKAPEPDTSTARPPKDMLPAQKRANDKLVLVKGAGYEDLRRVITGFCNMYNKEAYAALPQLFMLPGVVYAITFPYDVDFDIFCFFVNYLDAPLELQWTAAVTGRATDTVLDSKVMVYIPSDDTEHDHVWLIAPDNEAYRCSFGNMDKRKPMSSLDQSYRLPTIEPGEQAEANGELFH